MLVSIQKVRLKSDFVLTYLHALLSSTVSAIQRMRTCAPNEQIDAHVHPCRQIRAVNAGLLHHRESGLIPCAEGLRENYWLLASVSRSHCCRWASQPRWCLAREAGREEGERRGRGAPGSQCAAATMAGTVRGPFTSGYCHTQWCEEAYASNRGKGETRKTKCAVNISRKS